MTYLIPVSYPLHFPSLSLLFYQHRKMIGDDGGSVEGKKEERLVGAILTSPTCQLLHFYLSQKHVEKLTYQYN